METDHEGPDRVAAKPDGSESALEVPVLGIGIILLAVTLALYWPVQSFEFVSFDDNAYVTDNHRVQGGLAADGILWHLSNPDLGFWHPLTMISHMLDFELYGWNAGGHHWTSVLIHCAATVLLFVVWRSMTGALWGSALVAVLFAIHPLHVESVVWVAERKDVLSGLFWVVTMGAYAHYVRQPGLQRYLLVLFCFVLGLMSKPMVVTLPFVLLLLDFWPLRRFKGTETVFDRGFNAVAASLHAPGVRLAAEKLPLIAVASLSCIVTIAAQREGLWTLEKLPLERRIANALASYMEYARMMLWPDDLAVLYPHAGTPPAWKVGLAVLFLSSISYVAVRNTRQMPSLIVGWLWYLGTLVPVIGLVQVGSQSMADRYTYLPLVGLFIALAWGAKSVVEKHPHWRQSVIIGSIALIMGLMILARAQVGIWQNSLTLFEHTFSVTKRNHLAQNNIGAFYLERNDCRRAMPYFIRAVEMKENYADAYSNMGDCAARENQEEDALRYFQQAIALDPLFTKARIDRGLYLVKLGRLDAAEKDFRQILRIKPDHEGAHVNLSTIYIEEGRLEEAETHLRKAIRIHSGSAEAHNNIGLVFKAQGRREDALASFLKARELAPGNPVIEGNLLTLLKER